MSSLRGMLGPEPIQLEEEQQEEQPPVCYFFGRYADCTNENPQYCGACRHYLCVKPSP